MVSCHFSVVMEHIIIVVNQLRNGNDLRWHFEKIDIERKSHTKQAKTNNSNDIILIGFCVNEHQMFSILFLCFRFIFMQDTFVCIFDMNVINISSFSYIISFIAIAIHNERFIFCFVLHIHLDSNPQLEWLIKKKKLLCSDILMSM